MKKVTACCIVCSSVPRDQITKLELTVSEHNEGYEKHERERKRKRNHEISEGPATAASTPGAETASEATTAQTYSATTATQSHGYMYQGFTMTSEGHDSGQAEGNQVVRAAMSYSVVERLIDFLGPFFSRAFHVSHARLAERGAPITGTMNLIPPFVEDGDFKVEMWIGFGPGHELWKAFEVF
jgi:hypothetical protein